MIWGVLPPLFLETPIYIYICNTIYPVFSVKIPFLLMRFISLAKRSWPQSGSVEVRNVGVLRCTWFEFHSNPNAPNPAIYHKLRRWKNFCGFWQLFLFKVKVMFYPDVLQGVFWYIHVFVWVRCLPSRVKVVINWLHYCTRLHGDCTGSVRTILDFMECHLEIHIVIVPIGMYD